MSEAGGEGVRSGTAGARLPGVAQVIRPLRKPARPLAARHTPQGSSAPRVFTKEGPASPQPVCNALSRFSGTSTGVSSGRRAGQRAVLLTRTAALTSLRSERCVPSKSSWTRRGSRVSSTGLEWQEQVAVAAEGRVDSSCSEEPSRSVDTPHRMAHWGQSRSSPVVYMSALRSSLGAQQVKDPVLSLLWL